MLDLRKVTKSGDNGATRLHLMSEVVSETECGDEVHALSDGLSVDQEDPSTIAGRKLDWATLMTRLNRIERRLIQCLVNGMTVREICRAVKMTKRKLVELQSQVAQKIIEIMGADVLQQVLQSPQWRINLDAERELMACRSDRRG